LDHPIVGAQKPYSPTEAWIWLLFEAAWKARRVRVTNGRTVGTVAIERGQLSYSRSYMASAWGWSEKRVRSFLDRLEMDRMINRQKGQPQALITVCNYETYQTRAPKRGRQKDRQTGQQRAGKGPETKQGNQGTRENMRSRVGEPEGFTEWYEIYPRKRQRNDAERAFAKLMSAGNISRLELMARTQAFAAIWSACPDLKFCPYPASWLNSGAYLDTLEPVSIGNGGDFKIKTPTRRDPKTFTDSEWGDRLATFENNRRWPETYWGPRPGMPGCLVPSSLLISPIEREPKKQRGSG
jgi:hypothetical protein